MIEVLEPKTLILDHQQHKSAPCNIYAEQLLLGSFLINNEYIDAATEFVAANSFFLPAHQEIFDAVSTLRRNNALADVVSLKNYFTNNKNVKEIGGDEYILKLVNEASSAVINVSEYCKIIHDLYVKRKLIQINHDSSLKAYEPALGTNSQELIEQIEQELFNLSENHTASQGFVSLRQVLDVGISKTNIAIQNYINHLKDNPGSKAYFNGISTGFIKLDEMLGGLQQSDLLILAGRPSMGKTALGMNLAYNAAEYLCKNNNETKKPAVGFFSLEMSADQLAIRLLSMLTGFSSHEVRTGKISDNDFIKLQDVAKRLSMLPFFIDDTPAITISALRTRARRLKRQNNLSLLVIDYLQLIRPSGYSRESNRVQEISEITQGLKALAKELNIPIIALSQLSRSVEQREDKRPQLSDLRESGSIEQDSDVVMFIYRDEYYLERKKPTQDTTAPIYKEWQAKLEAVRNVSEVIIAKHRNGPVGTVALRFNSSTTKFDNLAEERGPYIPSLPNSAKYSDTQELTKKQ